MKNPNGFGSVFKLSGNRRRPWVAKVTKGRDVEGQQEFQIIGYFETKAEGLAALSQHRADPLGDLTEIKLGNLYELWSEQKFRHISKSTENNYRAAWRYISRYERSKFKDLRSSHWQKLMDELTDQALSRSTLSKIKTVIGMLYDFAIENDIVRRNHGQFIKIHKSGSSKKEIFTDFEIKKLVENDSNEWVQTILIMIYTGLRVSELLNLTVFDVDLENSIIRGGAEN